MFGSARLRRTCNSTTLLYSRQYVKTIAALKLTTYSAEASSEASPGAYPLNRRNDPDSPDADGFVNGARIGSRRVLDQENPGRVGDAGQPRPICQIGGLLDFVAAACFGSKFERKGVGRAKADGP